MFSRVLTVLTALALLFALCSCELLGVGETTAVGSGESQSESVTEKIGEASEADTDGNIDTETDPFVNTTVAVTPDKVENTTEKETVSETDCAHLRKEEVEITVKSCFEAGVTYVNCADCGETLAILELGYEEHTAGEWTVESEPAPGKEGVKTTNCTVCGEKLIEKIEALGYSEGLEFVSNGDGTCALVSRGSCNDDYISVPPKSPDGDKVISISKKAFFEDESVLGIYLPDTVEVINDQAFCYTYNLEEVYFSSGLKIIGKEAFHGCGLRKLELPDTVESVGYYGFHNCIRLETVTLPEGLREIGYAAFGYCDKLTALHIPASVEKLGQALVTPSCITKITVAEGNSRYEMAGNCLIEDGETIIVGYGNCSIPNGIKTIGNDAFFNNTDLTEIVIPSSVEYINQDAFAGTSIKEIVIPGKVYSIAVGAFAACENLEKVTLSNSVGFIGGYIFEWCDKLTEIRFYGSEEDWNSIDLDPDNEVLTKVGVTFVDGVSPDTVRGFGRTTISGNAAYVYDTLASGVLADTPIERIEFDRDKKVTVDDFSLGRMIFFSDHPECFWWGGTAKYYRTDDGTVTSVEPAYLYSGDALDSMREELAEKVAEIVATVPEGTVFEKALYLHDKVAETVTYKFTDNDQTPYGALVEGEAVCNGYATAYQLLLMECGIRAWTVNGVGNGVAHAWNVVWMDDEICVYTDVTWDDQEDALMRYYFNMSLDEIDDDHTVSEFFVLPECDHYDEGYYDVATDAKILTDADGAEVLVSFLSDEVDGQRSAQFLYTGEDFEAWLDKNINDLAQAVGEASVSYSVVGREIVLSLK